MRRHYANPEAPIGVMTGIVFALLRTIKDAEHKRARQVRIEKGPEVHSFDLVTRHALGNLLQDLLRGVVGPLNDAVGFSRAIARRFRLTWCPFRCPLPRWTLTAYCSA